MTSRGEHTHVPLPPTQHELREALRPLVAIANAYDENALDDEARKYWGQHDEHQNTTPPDQLELYTGRGGRRLLTLADCLRAREVVQRMEALRNVLETEG